MPCHGVECTIARSEDNAGALIADNGLCDARARTIGAAVIDGHFHRQHFETQITAHSGGQELFASLD